MDQQKIPETKPAEDDEISLIDLCAVLLHYKKLIIAVTVSGMIIALAVSILSLVLPSEKSFMPNLYTPQSEMIINTNDSSGSSLSSMLSSSSLGSLAELAGIKAGGASGSNGELAVYLCSTNSFLDKIVDAFDLVERYKIEKHLRAESRKALKKVFEAELDDTTGVLTLSFTDRDPEFACKVVNFATDQLEMRFKDLGLDQNQLKKENLEKTQDATLKEIYRLEKEMHDMESGRAVSSTALVPRIALEYAQLKREMEVQELVYKQLRQEYELLKITMSSETPTFQVLEYAEVPDQKSKPSRGMLCIIVAFASFFISVFIAFFLNALKNIKNDPQAMAKLKNGENW
ncbi:MAG: hypothetical protein NC041_08670 [Bacteroides sp.]|nr:hypothetical protein [Prevotella sp.]MCM1408663.1 lipopolysaccharide biosynthesis protein [Treponema brennaborense]MCM1470524.1 hypothetical protein [Bacteroides sp.]